MYISRRCRLARLNWGDEPSKERRVIQAAVDCCFHPLYEIDHGKTTITYDPEKKGKKIPVIEWLSMMEELNTLHDQSTNTSLKNSKQKLIEDGKD